MTAADVNGDGRPDLIVANDGDTTVSVLLNTTAPGASTPSFTPQQTFTDRHRPVLGDGGRPQWRRQARPDRGEQHRHHGLGAAQHHHSAVATFDSHSFASQQSFATDIGPRSVTTVDLNGDGKPDLIVADNSDNTVSVLLNTTTPGASTPSFATQQAFATGTSPYSVTAADVNGDGKPDLISANFSDDTVSVLLNTTAPGANPPSFASQQTVHRRHPSIFGDGGGSQRRWHARPDRGK